MPYQSKISINCHIGVSDNSNVGFFHIRLGKKVNGNVIWGHSSGMTTTRDDEQTDPKGDMEFRTN